MDRVAVSAVLEDRVRDWGLGVSTPPPLYVNKSGGQCSPGISVGATHASPLLLSVAFRLGYYRRELTEEEKKERIRYYADWIRSLWIGFLGLTGSLAGLTLTLDSRPKIILLAVGLIADSLLAVLIAFLHRRVERLLAALGREEP